MFCRLSRFYNITSITLFNFIVHNHIIKKSRSKTSRLRMNSLLTIFNLKRKFLLFGCDTLAPINTTVLLPQDPFERHSSVYLGELRTTECCMYSIPPPQRNIVA